MQASKMIVSYSSALFNWLFPKLTRTNCRKYRVEVEKGVSRNTGKHKNNILMARALVFPRIDLY